jgi:hypothetical protein
MKERPILFSGEMVRAILDGRKTQTRRVVKLDDGERMFGAPRSFQAYEICDGKEQGRFGFESEDGAYVCPYGQPGDRLWVRETWRVIANGGGYGKYGPVVGIEYQADKGQEYFFPTYPQRNRILAKSDQRFDRIRPSIHMPRWASRINLEVTAVRVERVQEITGADAIAEGLREDGECMGLVLYDCGKVESGRAASTDPREAFSYLWDSINDKRGCGWDKNPWVWVVEFRRRSERKK